MAKRCTEKLDNQITINLTPELRAFLEHQAEYENRTVAGQCRHLLVEAARRAGATNGLAPWPPPMGLPPTLNEARAELADATTELDALKALQRRGGHNRTGLLPHEDARFSYLRDRVANLSNMVEQHERMETRHG